MSTTHLPTTRTAPSVAVDVLAVVNARASGVADPARTRRAVARALAAAGATPEVRVTKSLEDLERAVLAADGRRLVLVGGDGALHTAANLGLPLPELALVPMGGANNLAHALGVPLELTAAAALAVGGAAAPLDALEVDLPHRRVLAVEGVSAGFQAAARARYHAENSGARVAGLLALAQTLAVLPRFSARIALDGAPPQRASFEQLFLSTMPFFSFGLRVDPAADPRDGTDEAVMLHVRSRHELLGALLAARSGRHVDRDDVEVRSWREAELLDPVPLAADGEPLGVSTARLRVVPGALRVVAERVAP